MSELGSIATEMGFFRRVHFYPDSGLNGRNADASGRGLLVFAAVFYATSYPAEARDQTRTNVNDLDRETLILLELPGSSLRS
jgi:hypothetical protein